MPSLCVFNICGPPEVLSKLLEMILLFSYDCWIVGAFAFFLAPSAYK